MESCREGWTGFSPVCLKSIWGLCWHLENEFSFLASEHLFQCDAKYTTVFLVISLLLWQVPLTDVKAVS